MISGAERDLLTKIKGVKAATLLAHGQHDWNVMPEHSIAFMKP